MKNTLKDRKFLRPMCVKVIIFSCKTFREIPSNILACARDHYMLDGIIKGNGRKDNHHNNNNNNNKYMRNMSDLFIVFLGGFRYEMLRR